MRIVPLAAACLAAIGLAGPASAAEPRKLWELDGLRWPESALPAGDVIYVSNVDGALGAKDGKGEISKVSADGKMIEADWVTGLNAPTGLGMIGGTLYVADIDELVAIDVATAKIVKRYKGEGAQFFNDVATGQDGRVYVSDTKTDTIWLMEHDSLMPYLKDPKLNAPNGLLVEGDKRLVVAQIGKPPKDGAAGEPGHLVTIALDDKSVSTLGEGGPIGYLDGLATIEPGSYLVTDWVQGPLLRVSSAGEVETLVKLPPKTADLAYVPETHVAIVPQSAEGKLIAYRIEKK